MLLKPGSDPLTLMSQVFQSIFWWIMLLKLVKTLPEVTGQSAFQSIFWWIMLLKYAGCGDRVVGAVVSIHLLVDYASEGGCRGVGPYPVRPFQSIFWWIMLLKVS